MNDEIIRAGVARLKAMISMRKPPYDLPPDSSLEDAVRDIIKLVSPEARRLTDDQIMNAAIKAADELDATRVSEMTAGGWKATTIFEGDAGLIRFGRLVEAACLPQPDTSQEQK